MDEQNERDEQNQPQPDGIPEERQPEPPAEEPAPIDTPEPEPAPSGAEEPVPPVPAHEPEIIPPPSPVPPPTPPANSQNNTLVTIGWVLVVLSFVCCCCGSIFAIPAVILGIVVYSRGDQRGLWIIIAGAVALMYAGGLVTIYSVNPNRWMGPMHRGWPGSPV